MRHFALLEISKCLLAIWAGRVRDHSYHLHAMAHRFFSCFAISLTLAMLLESVPRLVAAEGATQSNSVAPFQIKRLTLPEIEPALDANIRRRYEIEKAAWIWHPDFPVGKETVLLFQNNFNLSQAESVILHVSADQQRVCRRTRPCTPTLIYRPHDLAMRCSMRFRMD